MSLETIHRASRSGCDQECCGELTFSEQPRALIRVNHSAGEHVEVLYVPQLQRRHYSRVGLWRQNDFHRSQTLSKALVALIRQFQGFFFVPGIREIIEVEEHGYNSNRNDIALMDALVEYVFVDMLAACAREGDLLKNLGRIARDLANVAHGIESLYCGLKAECMY